MSEPLCEFRFDVPLPDRSDPRQFERGWRALLASQKLTALAVPPAEAVAARFRLCGERFAGERLSILERYVHSRLAALPGSPTVAADPPLPSPDWSGVKVWLSYRSGDVVRLLRPAKPQKSHLYPIRGRRR